VLAAGALATPHLLLASGLHLRNPGGRVVGRYLTRHCNAVVIGAFADPPGGGRVPYKEFAVHDFYFGHPARAAWRRAGTIQQTSLPDALVEREMPAVLRTGAPPRAAAPDGPARDDGRPADVVERRLARPQPPGRAGTSGAARRAPVHGP
jgi:hypothetical protein